MVRPQILMCPPDYFGIQYEINPWMSRARPADSERAAVQWRALADLLAAAGARIALVDPVPDLPDLVFTANAGIVYHRRVVLARFLHEVRQREVPHFDAALTRLGFTVEQPPAGVYFEGAGDALFCGDTLFAGYRIRSDARGHQLIAASLGCRVIPLELVDPYYYHLDTCFCPLAPGVAIYFPAAFDSYAQRALAELVPQLIAVDEAEARRFACNAVVIGRQVVTNTGCPRLHAALAELGFTPQETPLDEFVKSGGSAKCLTLRLDGEDAALWRQQSPATASLPG